MADSHITTSSYEPQEQERCAICDTDLNLYEMPPKWICKDHIAFMVSLAANDIWASMVSYSKQFEAILL